MKSFRLTLFFCLIAAIAVLGAWILGLLPAEALNESLPRLVILTVLVGAGLGLGLSVLAGKKETKEKLPPNSGPRF